MTNICTPRPPASTRGRPTKDHAKHLSLAILTTAEGLFAEHGFDLVTMEAIAAAVPISKGTLYARYRNKEDLYLAMMRRKLAELGDSFALVEARAYASFPEWFRAFAVAMADSISHPALIRFERTLGADARRFPELIAQFHQSAYQESSQSNAAAIEAAAAHFEFLIEAPGFVAEALRSLIWGWARLAPGVDPAEPSMAEIADGAANLLLTGLVGHGPGRDGDA